MVNNVLLDNVTHKDLKIITTSGEEYGDNIRFSLVVPGEFRQLSVCYPIIFKKDADSGEFEAIALLGFEKNENLMIENGEWVEHYVPLSIERLPFSIGRSEDAQSGELKSLIHVDMSHPRVSFTEGQAVFMPQGGSSEYLQRINEVLSELANGISESKIFFDSLDAENLLEPFTLKVQLNDSSKFEMPGFYTINEDRLNSLTKDTLYNLQKKGVLGLAYMALGSLSNIAKLIRKKENRLSVS